MYVTFVFDGLQFGGIERVGIDYIKLFSQNGYPVSVINLKPNLNALEKELPPNMEIQHILYPRAITAQRYSKLKKLGGFGKCIFYLTAVFW